MMCLSGKFRKRVGYGKAWCWKKKSIMEFVYMGFWKMTWVLLHMFYMFLSWKNSCIAINGILFANVKRVTKWATQYMAWGFSNKDAKADVNKVLQMFLGDVPENML